MRKLLGLLLALLVTVGCDDPTVHSLITSNFVCVYMPFWMGECDGTELTARAQNVLDHGLTQAHMSCEGDFNAYRQQSSPYITGHFTYAVDLLQDESCFTKTFIQQHAGPSSAPYKLDYYNRDQALATGCLQEVSGYSAHYSAGQVVIHSPEFSYGHPTCAGDISCNTPDTELDIDTVCTGFNLEAFE